MKEAREIKKAGEATLYAKPEITTLTAEQIIEDLGPASALYGSATGGGPISP
jgi:hypothetical protein